METVAWTLIVIWLFIAYKTFPGFDNHWPLWAIYLAFPLLPIAGFILGSL